MANRRHKAVRSLQGGKFVNRLSKAPKGEKKAMSFTLDLKADGEGEIESDRHLQRTAVSSDRAKIRTRGNTAYNKSLGGIRNAESGPIVDLRTRWRGFRRSRDQFGRKGMILSSLSEKNSIDRIRQRRGGFSYQSPTSAPIDFSRRFGEESTSSRPAARPRSVRYRNDAAKSRSPEGGGSMS